MTWLINLAIKFGLPAWLAPICAALLWFALALGVVWAIYDSGKRDERADWQSKQVVEAAQAQSRIDVLTVKNVALGKLSLGIATAAKTHYEQELTHEKTNFNRTIADVRAGAKRLSISTRAVPACSGGISLAAATRPAVDAETRSELSQAAAEHVIRFGNEADETVIESNYVKDLLQQCHDHVEALQAQFKPSNLNTSLQLSNE